MNNQDNFKKDALREYITPEKIEKAPEGFTSKVMTLIQLNAPSFSVAERSRGKNPVPVISVIVTILLIAAAFLIQGSKSGASALPVLSYIKNIKFSMPELSMSTLFHITFPSVVIYALLGLLVLGIFDSALYGIFKREK